MKACLALILIGLMTTVLHASSDRLKAIQLVRSIILHPDSWSDLSDESAKLTAAEGTLPKKEAEAIRVFRASFENYGDYFADYPFEMTADSRRSLVVAIRHYEDTFYALLRDEVAAQKAVHDGFYGCLSPPDLAYRNAIHSLDSLGPIFSPYSTKPERPNELAAIVIQVTHIYGAFLAQLMWEECDCPEIPARNERTSKQTLNER